MLEPNESEITLDIVEEACKSDYFSDEEVKIDRPSSESGFLSKRKPEDIISEVKKTRVSEDNSSKMSTANDSQTNSEFVRAGSVTSDNSDEFVDASDVLMEPPPPQEKKPISPTDEANSCAIKNSVASDTFKCNIFEPEVPKVKDNKFIKRLPTFADDPLERFNSSAIRRGLVKDAETFKPIDFNFDFNPSDKDKNEAKGENKTVKKVKLNRSKFVPAERSKFSDESSSDSNSRFNVSSSTSPAKSDSPVESKERNFKSVNVEKVEDKIVKLPIVEKISSPKETALGSVSSTVPVISMAAPAANLSTPTISVTPPASVDSTSTVVTFVTPTVSAPAPVIAFVKSNTQGDIVPDINLECDISSDSTKDESLINVNIVPEPPTDAISKKVSHTHNQSSPQTVIDEGENVCDEKLIEVAEIPISSLDDEPVQKIDQMQPEIIEPESENENLLPTADENIPEELNNESTDELVADPIQMKTDLPQEPAELSHQVEDEPCQKSNDNLPREMETEPQSIVTEPEVSETQPLIVSQIESESFEAESVSEANVVLEPEPSIVQDPSDSTPERMPIEETKNSISDFAPEPETVEKVSSVKPLVPNYEPKPSVEKSDNVDEIDLTSDTEDLVDDKAELEESNEESEGEIEEEEEEEDEVEVIHEEEVYLDDRIPTMIGSKVKSPPPQVVPHRVQSDEVMEIDDEDDEPIEVAKAPAKTISRESRRPRRTPSIENIEDIPMDIDESEPVSQSSAVNQLQKPKELSKLEQALIGKPLKKLEIQIPVVSDDISNEIHEAAAERTENEENKEKIKLHLSLQGDKVSIKKGPLDTPTGLVRVKRQYRKRRLENMDGEFGAKSADKTYKLRNRTVKKDEEEDTPQAQVTQNNGTVEVINVSERPIEVCSEFKPPTDRYSAEPVTIDLDDVDSPPTAKIQPIKLKISKNSNITIECGEKSRESGEKSVEDARKKDTIPNYMEKAATAWSGPDLQRVERLLKESNITITPVISKDAPPPQTPQPALKPMLASIKDKPAAQVPTFSTPSVSATVSLQTTTAALTPITKDKPEDKDSSADEMPSSPNDQTQNSTASSDREDQRRFSIQSDDSDVTTVSDKLIDVRSEIRKKLASAEKRKQEARDSNDSESELSDSKPKSKVPDLLPINFPTPEMLQSLANSMNASSTNGESDGKKAEIDPAFLPLLQTLPKKRGRPTKAMVAAREALKQSQEVALESLRQLASQKSAEGGDLMAHFPIPLFDISDPENPFKAKRGRKPKTDKGDKSDGDQSAMEDPILDPIREAEEIKRLEEERLRKEEERERKNEVRRLKAKERNDLVKAKRLRQKMKAEERQRRMQEKRRQLQEEKKKLEEEIKNLPSTLSGFDDETRMSAENSQLQSMSFSMGMGEDDSSNATTELSQRVKKSRMEVTDADSKDLTVDQIAEYQWPIQGGELYMIQEQVSNFLGVKSFKRKYPDIKRRPVDSEERAYLVDSGLVSETLCDLGLTAVCSAELLDIMCADFADKYEELRRHMREKQMKELSFKQKAWANGLGYKLLMADGTKQDLKKRAMESASNWNLALNKSRGEDRRCAMDLQTFIVHYPKNRTQRMSVTTPKIGSYPVSILPGQFCDYYKPYTSTELRYMPVNTVLYGPLKPHAVNHIGDGSQTDSDDSSSSDESSTTSEGTQNTEDTVEDMDKDMSVDESSQLGKTHDMCLLKDQMSMELSENTRELIMDEAAKILCKVCLGNMARNKDNVPEVLICCSQCSSTIHPSCLDLSLDMVPHIKKYAWQCSDCKICARCKENADEDKMLFCDTCDRGYHIYCVGLKKVPSGRWQCQECITNVEHTIYSNSAARDTFKEPGLIEIQDG